MQVVKTQASLRSDEITQNWEPDAISKPSVGHDFGKLKLNKPSINQGFNYTEFPMLFPMFLPVVLTIDTEVQWLPSEIHVHQQCC